MQSSLEIPGTHKEWFRCDQCEFPCECIETVRDGCLPRNPPMGCQRFPSRTPAWKRIE